MQADTELLRPANATGPPEYSGWLRRLHCSHRAEFRGPRGDGTSPATNVPLSWNESNNVAWKVLVSGRGRSSPSVLLDRLWLTTALEQGVKHTSMYEEDMLTAEHVTLEAVSLDRAPGNILWRSALLNSTTRPRSIRSIVGHPFPVIEPTRLYCDFGTFGTACLDADTGKVLWKTRLSDTRGPVPGDPAGGC